MPTRNSRSTAIPASDRSPITMVYVAVTHVAWKSSAPRVRTSGIIARTVLAWVPRQWPDEGSYRPCLSGGYSTDRRMVSMRMSMRWRRAVGLMPVSTACRRVAVSGSVSPTIC